MSLSLAFGCSTVPEDKHKEYKFPKFAFKNKPEREFEIIGAVRSKVNYSTLHSDRAPQALCQNYYNRAVGKLLRHAKKAGGDAVMQVRSVVFLMDGKGELHSKPECYDDGSEGQVLARGVAIRWKPDSDASTP